MRCKPVWTSICIQDAARTLALARVQRKECVSSEKWPLISPARFQAASEAAPVSSAQRQCCAPLLRIGDTRVAAIASWAPWNAGRPSAITSMRCWSCRSRSQEHWWRHWHFLPHKCELQIPTRPSPPQHTRPRTTWPRLST